MSICQTGVHAVGFSVSTATGDEHLNTSAGAGGNPPLGVLALPSVIARLGGLDLGFAGHEWKPFWVFLFSVKGLGF